MIKSNIYGGKSNSGIGHIYCMFVNDHFQQDMKIITLVRYCTRGNRIIYDKKDLFTDLNIYKA